MNNPFTPNFGQVPNVYAGRAELRSEMSQALEHPIGHPNQTTIVVGARGTGKTALLRAMAIQAEQNGWIAASVTCLPGMLEDILQQARRRGSEVLNPQSNMSLTSLSIGQLVSAGWQNTPEHNDNWRSRISDILDELAEQDIGLLILVDEVDPELDEMIQLAAIYQQLVGEERKVALFMAGLPHRVSQLLTNKSTSFLRRSAQRQLTPISSEEVASAFQETVKEAGKDIPPAALKEAVQAIDGFPYMMQLVGYRSWQASNLDDVIDSAAIETGVQKAEDDLRERVLKATLDDLSKGDLEFLQAMLEDEDGSRPDDVAERLGRNAAHVAMYRKRLLEQGVIIDLGKTRFKLALPGLQEYLPGYLDYNL